MIKKQIFIFTVLIFTFFAANAFASEISASLDAGLQTGLSGTVYNCNPLTVSHGTVSPYPACTITCNSGYTRNGNNCVATGGGGGGGGGGGAVVTTTVKIGDFNNDNKVDILDFNTLMINWGATGTNVADLNKDGKVDILDFNILMVNWTI